MGGVVKKVVGTDKPAPALAEPEKVTATAADTQAAMQRQASLRARRGMGGLFGRMLGGTEDKLGG
jgi:hypothetical protein